MLNHINIVNSLKKIVINALFVFFLILLLKSKIIQVLKVLGKIELSILVLGKKKFIYF